MLEIRRSTLSLSDLIQSPMYLPLILPETLFKLKNPSSITHWVAIEAWKETELVGLSLTEVYPLNRIGQLNSLVVKAVERGHGIGRELFAFTEDFLVQEEKVEIVELLYEQENPSSPALEKILTYLKWPSPQLLLMRCHFDLAFFDPPWIHYPYRLPPSMNFFSWKDLLPIERALIEYWGAQGRFLSYLSPLRDEEGIDLETSVGLRREGKIVGWSITRRPTPSTIRYSSLYIDRDFQQGGYGIQLLVESIRLNKKLAIPYAIFEINLQEIDPSWWHFVRRRLLPAANKIEHINKASRLLTCYLK